MAFGVYCHAMEYYWKIKTFTEVKKMRKNADCAAPHRGDIAGRYIRGTDFPGLHGSFQSFPNFTSAFGKQLDYFDM